MGSGGGGTLLGVSRARRERWRAFSSVSSVITVVAEAGVVDFVLRLIAFEVGSRVRGYWLKRSMLSAILFSFLSE
jgi:hypothetical protein